MVRRDIDNQFKSINYYKPTDEELFAIQLNENSYINKLINKLFDNIMAEKEYTLYANNINEELLDEIKETIDKYNINYTVVPFKDINGDGTRGIGNGDVALVCHFVSKTFNTYNDKTAYLKICNNGNGVGVCLLHINLDKLPLSFTEDKDSKEYLLNHIENSINWCEKHLSVDY